MIKKQKNIFVLVVGSAIFVVLIASLWSGRIESLEQEKASLEETTISENETSGILGGKETWNGLEIKILKFTKDGWPLIEAHNQFNDPPIKGKEMLLVTIEVRKVSAEGEDTISVDSSDFKVVGDKKIIYTTFSSETSCGVVPDRLDGVVTADHSISGAICVQVPKGEENFILIYETYVGGNPAVYIPFPGEE